MPELRVVRRPSVWGTVEPVRRNVTADTEKGTAEGGEELKQ